MSIECGLLLVNCSGMLERGRITGHLRGARVGQRSSVGADHRSHRLVTHVYGACSPEGGKSCSRFSMQRW
jgi:hypothetical protein